MGTGTARNERMVMLQRATTLAFEVCCRWLKSGGIDCAPSEGSLAVLDTPMLEVREVRDQRRRDESVGDVKRKKARNVCANAQTDELISGIRKIPTRRIAADKRKLLEVGEKGGEARMF